MIKRVKLELQRLLIKMNRPIVNSIEVDIYMYTQYADTIGTKKSLMIISNFFCCQML